MVAEFPFTKGFIGFAGFKVLVHVLDKFLGKHSIPDLIRGYIFYSFIHLGMDCPLTTEGGCPEKLVRTFF